MEDIVLIQQIWFVRHGNTPPHKLPNVSKGSLSNKYVLGFFIITFTCFRHCLVPRIWLHFDTNLTFVVFFLKKKIIIYVTDTLNRYMFEKESKRVKNVKLWSP